MNIEQTNFTPSNNLPPDSARPESCRSGETGGKSESIFAKGVGSIEDNATEFAGLARRGGEFIADSTTNNVTEFAGLTQRGGRFVADSVTNNVTEFTGLARRAGEFIAESFNNNRESFREGLEQTRTFFNRNK